VKVFKSHFVGHLSILRCLSKDLADCLLAWQSFERVQPPPGFGRHQDTRQYPLPKLFILFERAYDVFLFAI